MNTAEKFAKARAEAAKDGLPEASPARRAYVAMERPLEAAERGRAAAEERTWGVIHRRLEMSDKARVAAEERAKVAAAAVERLSSAVDSLSARLDVVERQMRLGSAKNTGSPVKVAPVSQRSIAEVGSDTDVLNGVQAIAAAIGVGRRQAYNWIERHGVPVFRIGSTICARRLTLNAWLVEQEARALRPKLEVQPLEASSEEEAASAPELTPRRRRPGRPSCKTLMQNRKVL